MPHTNRTSLLLLILLISNTDLFSQCEKEISTNPLNPINNEFMDLANEWYGDNAPYSINPYLNAFNWYPPGNVQYIINLNEGWEHNLVTSSSLPMNNPFVQSGDQTFIHAQSAITDNRDFHWEDGWELLWMNLGKYPDGSNAVGLTPGSVFGENDILHNPNPTNIPYFVLYNRYRGGAQTVCKCLEKQLAAELSGSINRPSI